MSVVAIVTTYAPSLVNFRLRLLSSLVSRGHTVYAFAPDVDQEVRSKLNELSVSVIEYSISRTKIDLLGDIRAILVLVSGIRRVKPDICLTYFAKAVIYGSLAARISGVPRIVAMIEGLGSGFTSAQSASCVKEFFTSLLKILYKIGLSGVSKVVFLNRDDIYDFQRWSLVKSRQLYLLGGIGVDLDYWKPSVKPQAELLFVMASRLIREKGVDQFIESARIVKRSYPCCRFVLLGGIDASPSSYSESELSRLSAMEIVEICGHVDVKPWLQRASVFVLPSFYREGVPRSIQEAMAMALPIITTNMPGCRDAVVDGINGYLVPPCNTPSLAQAMERFARQPELVGIMGTESRRMAEVLFDERISTSKLLEVLGA